MERGAEKAVEGVRRVEEEVGEIKSMCTKGDE